MRDEMKTDKRYPLLDRLVAEVLNPAPNSPGGYAAPHDCRDMAKQALSDVQYIRVHVIDLVGMLIERVRRLEVRLGNVTNEVQDVVEALREDEP